MPSTKDYLIGIYDKLAEIANTDISILNQLGGEPGEPHTPIESIISNYPRTDKKELPIGITDINTRLGKVILPDESVEWLSSPIPDDPCKSILLYTNAKIDMLLMEGDKTNLSSTIFPSWLRIDKITFDRIKITATEIATLYLSISNVAAPEIESLAATVNKPSWDHYITPVPIPGTPQQLTTLTIPDGYELVVQALDSNTRDIYLGNSLANVLDITKRQTLISGAATSFGVDNANLIFVDSIIATEGVQYFVETD